MLVTSIQCTSSVDHITEDGEPLYQRPYPYHIAPDGEVQQKGLWRDSLARLVGFQQRWDEQRVDLFWFQVQPEAEGRTITYTLDDAIGKYPVFVDGKGTLFSLPTPVESWTQREFTDEQVEVLNG